MKIILFLIIVVFISCNNKSSSLIDLEKKENEIQKLMQELSLCKEKKIKEKIKENYKNKYKNISIELNTKTDVYFNDELLGNIDKIYLDNIDANKINIIKIMRHKLPPRFIEIKPCEWKTIEDNIYYKKIYIPLEMKFIKQETEDKKNQSFKFKKEIKKEKNIIIEEKILSGECLQSDISRVMHNSIPNIEKCTNGFNIKKIKIFWNINKNGSVENINFKSYLPNKIKKCLYSVIKTGRYNYNMDGCSVSCNLSF